MAFQKQLEEKMTQIHKEDGKFRYEKYLPFFTHSFVLGNYKYLSEE